ncbi:hypothetical protein ACLTEW_14855 [Gordonia lacunae]|uniref:hypothetical protein n=1 Tax=Gordonia lacunae TaxID=417102 RepID=UPI0039E47841
MEENATTRLQVKGARITGHLDLGCGELAAFLFTQCIFDEQPMLNDAKAEFVGFVDCRVPGLSASRLRCNGPMWLNRSEFSRSVSISDSDIKDVAAIKLQMSESRGEHSFFDLAGARIEHDFDISAADINGHIVAAGAHVKGSMIIARASINSGSATAVFARLARIGGNVMAQNAKLIGAAGIDLEGAAVGGAAVLSEATIECEKGYAFNLDHAEVKLGVHANDIDAKGTISLHHATISCQVSLDRGRISTTSKGKYAIRADHARIDGSMHLNLATIARGAVFLHGADIECALNMHGINVDLQRSSAIAIAADAARIGGNIDASSAEVNGALVFEAARIGGRVRLGGKWRSSYRGGSIVFERATLASITVSDKLECETTFTLAESTVHGNLQLNDSTIGTPDGKSLDLAGAQVFGDVSVQRSVLKGTCDATRVDIKGDFRLADAKLDGTPAQKASRGSAVDQKRGGRWRGTSLRLNGGHVVGDIDLRGAVVAETVDLSSAIVDHTVDLQNAELAVSDGVCLNTSNAQLSRLDVRLKSRPTSGVNLQNSRIDILIDNQNSWPPSGELNIEGLQYRRLESTLSSEERLKWLECALDPFSPQPYDQLASMYKAKGNTEGEREVRLHAIKRSYASRGLLQQTWGQLQNATVGYGYRPFRALFWAVGMWLLGSIWFAYGPLSCSQTQAETPGLCPVNAAIHPTWNPVLLSMDLLSPFSAFGQEGAWHMNGFSIVVGMTLTLAGWILLTTIAAAFGRALKH